MSPVERDLALPLFPLLKLRCVHTRTGRARWAHMMRPLISCAKGTQVYSILMVHLLMHGMLMTSWQYLPGLVWVWVSSEFSASFFCRCFCSYSRSRFRWSGSDITRRTLLGFQSYCMRHGYKNKSPDKRKEDAAPENAENLRQQRWGGRGTATLSCRAVTSILSQRLPQK